MKKLIISMAASLALLSCAAFAAGTYNFEGNLDGGGAVSAVANDLSAGGEAVYASGLEGRGLRLDGSYGLALGRVGESFSVSMDVNISSAGSTDTLLFKNMGDSSAQSWTGVIYAGGAPKVWSHNGSDFRWSTLPSSAKSCTGRWVNLIYTEDKGRARLYIDSVLVSEGSVIYSADGGDLYLGATYWSADASEGTVDNLTVYDRALSDGEIRFPVYELPFSKVIGDIDLSAVPGGEDIAWVSDNEAVLSHSGKVSRQSEDVDVTLTAALNGVTREFNVTVLKLPSKVNNRVLLSYDFAENDGFLADKSGNGNHGVIYGALENGYFDGEKDYIRLPAGILGNLKEFTIVLRLTPEIAASDYFTFCFANSSEDGYFFLNTSRPETNTIRLAITDKSHAQERDIRSVPGVRGGEYAAVVITAEGNYYKMYVDGILVAEGDMGISASDLGETAVNYIGKSPYGGDPLFKGRFEEFTIYPSVMSEEEIYSAYYVPEEELPYFACVELGEALTARLNRDCIVAVSLRAADGSLIYADTKKVSDDNLTVEFDAAGAAQAEIAAFDAATGIVKDIRSISAGSGIVAYGVSGGVKIENTSDRDADLIVIDAAYSGGVLSAVDAVTVTVEASSFVVVPVSEKQENKVFVWTPPERMMPVARK